MLLNSIKIRTKIIILAVILLSVTVWIAGVSIMKQSKATEESLRILEQSIRTDYDNNVRSQVESVVALLEGIYEKYKVGEYTLEEAKRIAADSVRSMHYGEDGYFWIDTYEGVNVVYMGSETEGRNRLATEDENGFRMIEAIIMAGQQEGGGYTDYWFPKKVGEKAYPKRSYSLSFEPFEWVVGTGNYTDYVDEYIQAVSEEEKKEAASNIAELVTVSALSFVFAAVIAVYISLSLHKSFHIVRNYIQTLATGDFTAGLPKDYLKRKDDFGILARDMETMKDSVTKLVGSSKHASDNIIDVVKNINHDILILNDNISDVAATSEELAASMEETAAAADVMSTNSVEIETATRTIAEKSQEAALKVLEISRRAQNTKEEIQLSQDKADSMGEEIGEKLKVALKQAEVVTEISVLTDAIMNITAQTNLLALNASIEAARAGESGRGFAVVAEQIRQLADQSKKAVTKIQDVTGEVTGAMVNLTDSSRALLQYVSKDITTSFRDFMKVAEDYNQDAVYMDVLITDFSATAQELLASIENIMHSVNEVAQAATEGAMGTGDIAEKISSVTNMSFEVAKLAEISKENSEVLQHEISSFII